VGWPGTIPAGLAVGFAIEKVWETCRPRVRRTGDPTDSTTGEELVTDADTWLRQAEEDNRNALDRAAELREAVNRTRGTARSADGLVTAVVAPGGALVSLDLDERAVAQSARALQATIVDTIHRASADAAAQLEARIRPVVGDRLDEAMEAVRSEVPEVAGLPRRETVADDDEDMSQTGVFGKGGNR
jgi:DNA-binding protein YbaB